MRIIQLMLTVFVLSACNTQQNAKESTRLTNHSKQLLQDNKLDEALPIVEKAIQLDPTNYVAYNNRAYIKSQKNRPSQEVLADYYKALSIKADYEISLSSLANYYFRIKNYDSCIARTDVYLAYANKYNFDKTLIQHNYAIRGESKYMLTHFDDAIIDIAKAIELDSLDAGPHKVLGDCYFYQNAVDKAIKKLTKAIELENDYYQAYLARARCYEKLGTPKSLILAELDYKEAFKLNPAAEDIYDTNSTLFRKIKQSRK